MSAVRNNPARRANRSQASPYARPTQKKSGWSIGGLLSFLNPLKRRSSSPDFEEDYEQGIPTSLPADRPVAEALSARGRQMAHNLSILARPNAVAGPSSQPPIQPPAPQAQTRDANNNLRQQMPKYTPTELVGSLDQVAAFLAEKQGQPLNAVETEGIISLIEKNSSGKTHEPFRFTSSTPSTPGRGNSPVLGFGASSSMPTFGAADNADMPRKTLTKNPNGVYTWQGGGSAKPRNRYRSPAFGPSKSIPGGLKLRPPTNEVPKTDTKRRRVGNEPAASVPQSVPITNISHANQLSQTSNTNSSSNSNANATPSTSLTTGNNGTQQTTSKRPTSSLRLSAAPSAPAIPSPLRQAWGQSDSTPQAQTAGKPTKAATFMADLIKEVTPPRKPDVSNPYQTASPVKPTPKPKKVPVKRTRATGKLTPPSSEMTKEPELPSQAIIEATVPKGSKRSRPPANLEKSSPNALPISTNGEDSERLSPNQEVDDDESASLPKKKKRATINGNDKPLTARKPPPSVTVEEIVDNEDPSVPPTPTLKPAEIIEPVESVASNVNGAKTAAPAPPAPPGGSSFFTQPISAPSITNNHRQGQSTGTTAPKSFIPREPSKLRFSSQPESLPVEASTSDSTSKPTAAAPLKKNLSAKEIALATPASSLPLQTFDVVGARSFSAAALKAKDTNISSVPRDAFNFDFKSPQPLPPAAQKAKAASHVPSFDFASKAETKPPAATATFDWGAAGMKPPTKPAGSQWTCDTCMCSNPASATEKCTVCETPAPTSVTAKSSGTTSADTSGGGFDWAAAGMKPPTPTASGWTCNTCMCSNPATAVEKCGVCETPR